MKKMLKKLFAKLLVSYREHCADVAQLRVERAEAHQKVADAKLEIALSKSDPEFATAHLLEGTNLLDDAIEDYENALFLDESRSYLGSAGITGKIIMAIPAVLITVLAIAFVGDKVAGAIGLVAFSTEYNLIVAAAFLAIGIPAAISIDSGFVYKLRMKAKIARLKALRRGISNAEFLREFA